MAIKALNSIGGFSVGDTPANIILANGDITTINFTSNGTANLGNVGNVKIGGGTGGYVLSTDGAGNLSWEATGSPTSIHNENSNVSIPVANSNIYINANSGTNQQWAFETTGNTVFPSTGTANLGNLVIANYANFTNDVVVQGNISNANNINVTNNITTNTANLTGNLTGTYANFANDVAISGNISNVNNISITLNLEGNTANFSGNIRSLNANLGNLVIANYANFANDVAILGNIANANNISVTNNITTNTANLTGNLTGTYANFANDVAVQGNIANANNISVTNNITSNTANVTGNLTAGNVDGATFIVANSFTSNGGTVDFATNNANVKLGNVGNVHISGGTNGYLLTTDGAGNLSWSATASTTEIFNGNSNVSIPVANGNVNTSVAGNANVFVVTGTGANVTGTLDVTSNVTAANANLGNLVIANYANFANDLVVQGNIANANNISVTNNITTNTANLTGNLTGTYANFANDLVVQGNISNANNISVTNNITTNTANLTGNLTGTYANFANDLVVQGNIANANNITITNNLNVGGNISGVNYITANVANITDVVNTGVIANGTSNISLAASGNVTTNANGNATLTITNLGANVVGYIQANGVISAGGFSGSNLVSNIGILSLQATQAGGNYNINLLAGGNGNIDVGTTYITSVKDPLNAQDAATKAYVDSVAQGLDIKASVQFATAAVLPAYTYNNGTSGVGATITANANGALTIDGGSPAATQRVLIKNETGDVSGANSAYNGIYVVTDAGGVGTPFILTRATDFDNGNPSGEIPGAFTFVEQGSTNADTGWVCTTNNPVTVGTTPIAFTQFSSAGSYSANTSAGLELIGTQFNAKVDGVTTAFIGGNIAVANSAVLITPNIGAATGTSVDLSGNVLAQNVSANAKVTAANVDVTANVLANNFSANSNITSNNATVNLALTGNTANFSGNVILNNLTVNLELAGNTANFTGNINSALNANLGNLVTANYVNVANQVNGNIASFTGNITGANVIANSFVFAPAIVQNASTYDTRISLNSVTGIIEANTYGNATQFLPAGQIRLGGASQVIGGTLDGSILVLGASQTDLVQNRGGNVTVQVGTGGSTANTWTFANNGNTIFPAAATVSLGNLATANTVTVNNNLNVGNSIITSQTTTTLSTGANQTIATFTVTGTSVVGVEFFVKGVEAAGLKYSVAMVQAVTDGAAVDYAIYGGVRLGDTTGALAVNMTSAGGNTNINLQVTPASSNSTVWTTQIRLV